MNRIDARPGLLVGLFSAALVSMAAVAAPVVKSAAKPAPKAVKPVFVPHLGEAGQAEFGSYLASPDHRAFAIAPGGTFGWISEVSSRDAAEESALTRCQTATAQKCVLFSSDGEVVFDARNWPKLWGPYLSADEARKAPVGREVGRRFFDLAFGSPAGEKLSVGQLRGKVVVLHFWGSWCGPCRKEMPELQRMHQELQGRSDIALILLQVRERFEVSRRWAQGQKIGLPFYDSGSAGEEDASFRLAGGGQVRDRDIAGRFPTTYVLDKHGVVVFSHVGPIQNWREYEVFLRDAAERSGK